jgi:pimeloyl-ACP methyl ester carboxylesterase
VEIAGAGKPLVCLHTAGQNGVQWRAAIEPLAELGYQVMVPDLPGHGRSDPAPEGPVRDLGRYGDWCIALIEALGLDRPAVVGCSIGGKIALDLAVKTGSTLSGVVAMAADARNRKLRVTALERELADVDAASRSDRTYYGTLAVLGRSVSAQRAERIALMHRREDPAVTTSDLIGWASHDVSDQLPAIACPVHLVVGEDDLWLDADDARSAAARIPDGRFTLLPGIGHYPMEELADFPALLHGWLRELHGARRDGH